MHITKDFGVMLKEARVAQGMSQPELGRKLGDLTKSYISRMERGDRDISIRRIPRLARILKMESAEVYISVAKARGYFYLPFSESEEHAKLGALLAQTWAKLPKAKCVEIRQLLEKKK